MFASGIEGRNRGRGTRRETSSSPPPRRGRRVRLLLTPADLFCRAMASITYSIDFVRKRLEALRLEGFAGALSSSSWNPPRWGPRSSPSDPPGRSAQPHVDRPAQAPDAAQSCRRTCWASARPPRRWRFGRTRRGRCWGRRSRGRGVGWRPGSRRSPAACGPAGQSSGALRRAWYRWYLKWVRTLDDMDRPGRRRWRYARRRL